MTFTNILADLYSRLGFLDTPAAGVTTRLKRFINETQQELSGEPGLANLLRGSLTFATTADRPEDGLPPAVARVVTIREATTNRRLRQESLDWYRWNVPDPTQVTGTPAVYVPLGWKAVQHQPADASSLFVKSTSAADTTQSVHYEVRVTDGTIRTGSVVLTGTTAVALSATISTIEEVLDLYLSAVGAGTVTLHEDSGLGTELSRIGIGKVRSTYPWIAFVPTPSDAITYTLDYERDATDLVQDGDEPAWIPSRFHRLLSLGARKKEYEKTDDQRRMLASAEFDAELAKLLLYVNNTPDTVLVPGGARRGWSDLGGNYPAGTIWD